MQVNKTITMETRTKELVGWLEDIKETSSEINFLRGYDIHDVEYLASFKLSLTLLLHIVNETYTQGKHYPQSLVSEWVLENPENYTISYLVQGGEAVTAEDVVNELSNYE